MAPTFATTMFIATMVATMMLAVAANIVGDPLTKRNICEPTSSLFCNCDNHDHAIAITCYTVADGPMLTSNDSIWWSFASQPYIETLKISGWKDMRLTAFPAPVFVILKNSLREVVLSDLHIKVLPARAFYDMPLLESVEITLCTRMMIEDGAFDRLPRLEKVVMTKNTIPIVPDMFRQVGTLRELYLEDNKIETFADGTFATLHSLSYLTLDRNKIKQIEPEKYRGLNNLTSLELTSNMIKHIPARAFMAMPSLAEIDLSNNQIETIDPEAFAGLNKLQEIRLDHNRLEVIESQFSALPNLLTVNLEHNKLRAISKQSFHRPLQKRYVHIKIKGNEALQCNCHLYWLTEVMEHENRFVQELKMMRCAVGEHQNQNPLTVYEFLTGNDAERQCRLPEPILEPGDIYDTALPIQTIDSISDLDDGADDDVETIVVKQSSPMPEFPPPSKGKTQQEDNGFNDQHKASDEREREEDDDDDDERKEPSSIDLNRSGVFGSGERTPKGNGSAALKPHSLLLLLFFMPFFHILLYVRCIRFPVPTLFITAKR